MKQFIKNAKTTKGSQIRREYRGARSKRKYANGTAARLAGRQSKSIENNKKKTKNYKKKDNDKYRMRMYQYRSRKRKVFSNESLSRSIALSSSSRYRNKLTPSFAL